MKNHVTFQNGLHMPIVGLGTFQATDEKQLEEALDVALEAGYRHIDTAYLYNNEAIIGRVLKKWFDSGKLKREDVFIVTKLPGIGVHPDRVPYFLKKSLESLQLDYVDLYLIHSPVGMQYVDDNTMFPMKDGQALLDMNTDLISVWRAMEKQVDDGLVKSIGVSNFDESQIERLASVARIPIANHQVELHVYLQQHNLRDVCAKHNITMCAFGPLGSPGRVELFKKRGMEFKDPGLLQDPVVTEIAKQHGKTTGQILLKFLCQEGIVVIPKSVTPERIKSNIDIFDFELDSTEMTKLRNLDKGEAGRSFTFNAFKGIEKHPECPSFIKAILTASN